MSPGATFERVYAALKSQIVAGGLAPGAQLEPRLLAEDLVSSITPVRDALHRLVGERLVETPRNDGFRIPLRTEAMLRDLYAWNARLLVSALPDLRAKPAQEPRHETAQQERPRSAASLFLAIAGMPASPELRLAVASANERLGALRLAEASLILDEGSELEGMEEALGAADRQRLKRLILAYHRRREKLVPEILACLSPQF